ncbi:MAG: lipoyl synthase [Candidatus Omnitrophica bacterium]|nr:lipoyl synthase [Candidatus Omnitrophota bacterium]
MQKQSRRPHWLKKKLLSNHPAIEYTKAVLKASGANTVCQAASCPNIFDCFSRKTATFLILGRNCTRNCAFCSVAKGPAEAVDNAEPGRILEAVMALGLERVVITSVTRDDLKDGGSCQFVRVIEELRRKLGGRLVIEALVPDFRGKIDDIKRVAECEVDVFAHNIETAPRLYKKIRPGADYKRSIDLLRGAKAVNPRLKTKSGFMLGLGEARDEMAEVIKDLKAAGCETLSIGQYLRPSSLQVEVREFIKPDKFREYERLGHEAGFQDVQSGPFVRSSYRP